MFIHPARHLIMTLVRLNRRIGRELPVERDQVCGKLPTSSREARNGRDGSALGMASLEGQRLRDNRYTELFFEKTS